MRWRELWCPKPYKGHTIELFKGYEDKWKRIHEKEWWAVEIDRWVETLITHHRIAGKHTKKGEKFNGNQQTIMEKPLN